MKYSESIEKHYVENWAPPMERIRWPSGPIAELPGDFHVLVMPRSSEMWAFATVCMSDPSDECPIELHLFAPPYAENVQSLAELLTAIAHYHRTGKHLGHGHSVNFGRSWLPGSPCTHGLISLPYLDGPPLEYSERIQTRFLWLIPVTQAEINYKKRHGLEALEECFEKQYGRRSGWFIQCAESGGQGACSTATTAHSHANPSPPF